MTIGLSRLDTEDLQTSLEHEQSSQSLMSVEDIGVGLWAPGSVTPRTPPIRGREGTPTSPLTPLTPQMISVMSEMDVRELHKQKAFGKHQRRCLELAKQSFKCISDARGRGDRPCGGLFDNYMMCRRSSLDINSQGQNPDSFPS